MACVVTNEDMCSFGYLSVVHHSRAFSDLFGKFLVPMKLRKKRVILGKNMLILGKNSAIFNKIGKVCLLNLDFSAIWECSRSIGNFFSQFGKNLVPETGPSFVYRKSPA